MLWASIIEYFNSYLFWFNNAALGNIQDLSCKPHAYGCRLGFGLWTGSYDSYQCYTVAKGIDLFMDATSKTRSTQLLSVNSWQSFLWAWQLQQTNLLPVQPRKRSRAPKLSLRAQEIGNWVVHHCQAMITPKKLWSAVNSSNRTRKIVCRGHQILPPQPTSISASFCLFNGCKNLRLKKETSGSQFETRNIYSVYRPVPPVLLHQKKTLVGRMSSRDCECRLTGLAITAPPGFNTPNLLMIS